MSLSCVIATKNRPQSVQRLLDSIAMQDSLPLEIVIVNDGGESHTFNTHGIDLTLIENQTSLGSGRARNVGVARSRGQIILLLDDDVELISADFISRGINGLTDPKVGLAFPRKIDVTGHHSVELSFFSENPLTGELCGISEKVHDPETSASPVLGPMVTFIRREVFEEVGGYDFIYGRGRGHSFREESDFQLRVQERGWKVAVLKEIFFKHHIQAAGGHGPHLFKKLFWIGHNQVIFGARHQKFWVGKAILFAGFELPRYSWGNGRLLTYPAGLLGWSAGMVSSVFGLTKSKSRRR